jgi:hypothetical protein
MYVAHVNCAQNCWMSCVAERMRVRHDKSPEGSKHGFLSSPSTVTVVMDEPGQMFKMSSVMQGTRKWLC